MMKKMYAARRKGTRGQKKPSIHERRGTTVRKRGRKGDRDR